jgi:sporadic carbohydrate cluster protein (TIGR04323 family)
MKKIKGYIFSRKFYGERVPQHIQNQILREYCKVNSLEYLLSATEYTIEESSLMLNKLIKEIKETDGIIFYSIFQLPKKQEERQNVYNRIVNLKKEIHFAVENMGLQKSSDSIEIEQILQIKKTLPSCLKSI